MWVYLLPVSKLPHAVSLSTPAILSIVFASAYLALGPGCFFSVDEVVVEEAAQSLYLRSTLEIPGMNTAVRGRAGAYYGHRGPALGYISMPFVTIGSFLDNRIGSLQGGTAAGRPLGTLEHPLRWGGRFSIFGALVTNAVVGGLTVAILYLIALRFGVGHSVALAFACATGAATLLVSESTHFFQHPLETFSLLCGFWFLSGTDRETHARRAWLGGLSIGLAMLARPNAAPAAVVIWLYGALVARAQAKNGDRGPWLSMVARSAAGPAVSVVLYLMYNYVQYGDIFKTGYGGENGILRFSLIEPTKALIAYLVSPALSVFLFAPVMLSILFVWKQSLKRWPLETKCLLLAAGAHFFTIASIPVWDGAIAYGPRYVLAAILLLMPLTLPAFEMAFKERIRTWRIAMAAMILLGVFVQIVGVAVYVATNEWYYNSQNIYESRAFLFLPAASPVWVQLQDMLAGRNIIPWAWRAVSQPGPALLLLIVLAVVIAAGTWLLRIARSPDGGPAVPEVSILTMSSLVLLGFFATSPVVAPVQQRIVDHLNAGLAAQQSGRDVEAEELYALVLSLDPGNKFALHNLALLYEKIGKTTESVLLYERALASDPTFTPSVRNIARARYDLADYEGAVEDYRRAVELSPSEDDLRTDLAWALLNASRFQEAREVCNEVLAHDSRNAAAQAILARLPN